MPKGVYVRTEEMKKNIGKYVRTKEIKNKNSDSMKGKYIGEKNPNYGNTGEKNPTYGKYWSKEAKEKISGENSHKWKGNNVCIIELHNRVRKHKPKPKVCEICHQKADKKSIIKLELSNIKDHQYTDNPDDYQYVHHSCHNTYDSKKRKEKQKKSE